MGHVLLKTDELAVLVGDNAAGQGDHAAHCAGYNGVWSLTSVHAPENCYVPRLAGLNLEHCMDGLFMTEAGGDIFEPRAHPMQLERLDAQSACLRQDRTPLTGVTSQTIFSVQEPHCIDMVFTAELHQAPRAGRRFGFFWASYMNAPQMPALQFINADGLWSSLSPDTHGGQGGNTVCHASVNEPAMGEPGHQYNTSLAHSFSARRFDLPLMFGRPGDGSMLYLQMFDQKASVRLCMSPSGGGVNKRKRLYNPAWDFQYVVEEAQAGTQFALRSRVVYKPYTGRDEIEALYMAWLATLEADVASER